MRNPTELDMIHLRRAEELIKGEKSFEDYSQKRGINSKVKLDEMSFFSSNSVKFNLYLNEVTVGCRFLAMKAVLNLEIADIVEISGYSKTTIYDFIRGNLHFNQNRYFSDYLVYHLAIILDLPYKYLYFHDVKVKNDSFDEYELKTIPTISLANTFRLIYETLTLRVTREIFGVRVENKIFKYEVGYLFSRIDIKKNWFTLEFYITNPLSINNVAIKEMQKYIKGKSKIFIRDAFLREGKKIILCVFLEDEPVDFDKYSYLDARLLY